MTATAEAQITASRSAVLYPGKSNEETVMMMSSVGLCSLNNVYHIGQIAQSQTSFTGMVDMGSFLGKSMQYCPRLDLPYPLIYMS